MNEHESQSQSLLQTEEFLRAAIDSSAGGFYAIDTEGVTTDCNSEFLRMLGFEKREDAIGRKLHDVIHHSHSDGRSYPKEQCPIYLAAKTGIASHISNEHFYRLDGSSFPVEYWSVPIKLRGEIRGAVTTFLDVTDRNTARENLNDQIELTKTITENAASCLFFMNERGYPTYMNPSAERLTGFKLEEIKNRLLVEVLKPQSQAATGSQPITTELQDIVGKHDSIRDKEATICNRWGLHFPVSYSITPFLKEGKVQGSVLEFREITELKQSQKALGESMEILQTLNQLGPVLTAELNLDRLVQSITDIATKLCGAQFGALFYNVVHATGEAYTLYTISGVPREAFSKFPMPRNTQVFSPTFSGNAVVRSDDITKDPRYGRNDPHFGMPKGHLPVVSYLAIPVTARSGEVMGGLFFGHPQPGMFSEKHEELLVGVAAQAAIAIDNARLYKRAQEAVHARDEFLSIASHELKTPLTSLKLQAQLHRRAVTRKDPKAYSHENFESMIQLTERQVTRLTRLVDDMLDVSRIRTGKLQIEREPFDLRELAQETLARLKTQFVEAKCDLPVLHAPNPVKGSWDRFRIEQVLTNLLTNAIRYGNGQPIEVSVTSSNESVHLAVKDQGIGISAEARAKIFDRFERAVDANEISGLGLGLFITKQIVLAHGGRIRVESEIGKGAQFIVELPSQVPL